MSSVSEHATGGALAVTCPECGDSHRIDVVGDVELTDHNPHGVIEVTCGACGEEFVVGFRRRDADER